MNLIIMLYAILLLIVVVVSVMPFLLLLSTVVGVIILAVRNRLTILQAFEKLFSFYLVLLRRIWYTVFKINQEKK